LIQKFTRTQVATSLAVLFHTIGILGIFFFDRDFILRTTPINLLLMFVLLVWTHREKNLSFWFFFIFVFLTGTAVEIIGVNTSALFGEYQYGKALGYQLYNVPLIIGINWFLIIYCCGISIHTLLTKAINRLAADTGKTPAALKAISVIIDGATMAVFFDWVMEPIASKLNYWNWGGNGSIPFFNYLCWFLISVFLLALFHYSKFNKQNKFAVNLLLIQLMFFLLLRTFL